MHYLFSRWCLLPTIICCDKSQCRPEATRSALSHLLMTPTLELDQLLLLLHPIMMEIMLPVAIVTGEGDVRLAAAPPIAACAVAVGAWEVMDVRVMDVGMDVGVMVMSVEVGWEDFIRGKEVDR